MSLTESLCCHNLHRLIEVCVEESGTTVAQHRRNDVKGVGLQRCCLFATPCHTDKGCLLTNDSCIGRSAQYWLGREYWLADILTGLHSAEILVDDGYYLIGIEITSHTDRHIVGHIPLPEIVLDIGDGRVLQVILGTDGSLCAIGMGWGKFLANGAPKFVVIVGEIDIVLLINGLKFGMEAANYHILKTIRLNLGPVVNLVGGNIFCIAGHIVAGISIGTLCADG